MGGGSTTSSGRKRPYDSVSGKKDGTHNNKKKKGKKKGMNQKDVGGAGGQSYPAGTDQHSYQVSSSLDKTADKEGKIMAQVMSTFSRLEQSRFEAFRRVTFPADTISKFVAHCLIEEQHPPASDGVHVSTERERIDRSGSGGKNPGCRRPPMLSEVCAPGQASEITMIVSTLAKSYAQRLVTAARQHAIQRITAQSQKGNAVDGDNSHNNQINIRDGIVALTTDDIHRALEERRANGLDPGFFLPSSSTVRYTRQRSVMVPNDKETQQLKLLATLQAQEEYDKIYGCDQPEQMDLDDDDETDGTKEGHEELSQDDDDKANADIDENDEDSDDLGVDWGDNPVTVRESSE